MKIQVGQKLYLKPIGNRARSSNVIEETTVTKVGRKYFEVEGRYFGRFEIDSMLQDNGGYISNYEAYTSLQAIQDEKEQVMLYDKIKRQYFQSGRPTIGLDELREIDAMLNSDKEDAGSDTTEAR